MVMRTSGSATQALLTSTAAEQLEGEDRTDDQRRLQAGAQQRKDDVAQRLPAPRAEDRCRLSVVFGDELQPGEQDNHDDGRGPPYFREHDYPEEPVGTFDAEEDD